MTSPLVYSLASGCLRDAGYRTLEAHNAKQAIDLLEKGKHVDVVFSDVQRPGMDGVELQRRVGRYRPRVKVLFASGERQSGQRINGTAALALFRPYDIASLEQRIRELIRE